MKKGFLFLMMALLGTLIFSCSNTKSYGEMLKDERKAIEKLVRDSGFVVLSEFPEDGKFKPNEFVRLDGDIYMNIVDTGNGVRAVENKTKVYVRFEVKGLMGSDTTIVDISGNESYPTWFNYPLNADYGYPINQTEGLRYTFVSEGISVPLQYVGEHGIVKLIVPFKKGSEYDQTNGNPRYYHWLKYTKFE